MKIAIIMFPGTNCEKETAHAINKTGMQAKIVRWNDYENLHHYQGYILPGGWSYEDRVRAGIVASKNNVMEIIREQALLGKPVLGICNGCQILAESGMIPNLGFEKSEIALAPNKNPFISGFYCTWGYVKNKKRTAFTLTMNENEIIPMPIAHGEGRFVSNNEQVTEDIQKNIAFSYVTKNGKEELFPTNPNGSIFNIAGLSNNEGNVVGLMPHPERASFLRQLPTTQKKTFEESEQKAPALKVFESMKQYIQNGNRIIR